jgi:hypothetical protein
MNLNMGSMRLWLPTPTPAPMISAPLPKVKVTGSGTLASGLRRLTFTRKCVKKVPLTKIFSPKLSSSSSHSPSRDAAAAQPTRVSSSSSSTATKANVVKRDTTGERPPQRIDSGSSVSSCGHHPLLAEPPPPPYQLRVANPARASSEYDYDHIHGHGVAATGAMSSESSSSSRFTAASIEAIRAPDSPVPSTFPSPKLSTESVFGSTRSLSLASLCVSESEFGTGAGAISDAPRYICTLRNSAARGAAGPAPPLRRKNTIGFARRVHTPSSGLGLR